MDFASLGTASGHAYWFSGVTLRDSSGSAPLGTVDVRSEGFGVGDPAPSGVVPGAGALTGGTLPAISFVSQKQTWGPAPRRPVRDALDITATNVSAFTVAAQRARVDCNATLNVTTDGPLTVTISGCPPRSFG
jgi:hypothetical protein